MREKFSQSSDPAFHQICRCLVRDLIERYEWALLSEDDLVDLVLSSARPGTSPDELERVAKHHYTRVLYEACRQSDDPRRRERAYRDLHRYLYRAAYHRWPELAEDATQRALMLVYEQIDRCREPGTFLAFALWKLRHAFQQEQRARRLVQDDEVLAVEMERRHASPPSARKEILRDERVSLLVKALCELSDPRKRQAIALKYFSDLSDAEIGQRLDVSVSYVRVLRHRGIKELRGDGRLRRYFDIPEDDNL